MDNFTISCTKLKKIYGFGSTKFEALKDVNLHVKENELLMLVGPSGSGKTTLLSVIASILNYEEGEVNVLGKNLKKLTNDEKTLFRRNNIGFIFQSFNLIPSLTALENVSIPLLIQNIEENEVYERSKIILEKLNLSDKLDKYPNELSGGEMQRVSLARGFIHNPKILLCDEPTSFLDSKNGKMVMEILKSIQKEYKTSVIVVTHDPRILEYASRIIEIQDGIIRNEINHNN